MPHWRVGRSPAFLMQLPCSWGALWFRPHWALFLRFVAMRRHPPFYNMTQELHQTGARHERQRLGDPRLWLPGSRTNVWPRSWKRFMVDFMYGRGGFMLYPQASHQRSFSTTYMERGDHSGIDGKAEHHKATADTLRKSSDLDRRKTVHRDHDRHRISARFTYDGGHFFMQVPLLSAAEGHEASLLWARMPLWKRLPVIDLHHQREKQEHIQRVGELFVEELSTPPSPIWDRHLPSWATPEEYAALGKLWLANPTNETTIPNAVASLRRARRAALE